ncbi:Hypothetical protein LEPBI_I1442 [Leptospira biflexa serovar Patoc strain 'Patoc 1 (Paris)']|uniref:Uncharacterized protein n=1 Tax=Leptospira biflexa serovar Patoc (strain Patoc 1 / ATCC 23582 / Paris) TaxID=456481 RepID=B0SPY4_LEPBP|nr:Hypothetical protein LEPBI_I1442 [Leptospira biflexa serovar Patoc strain 'Patoc 1 (Paris)']
MWDDVRNLPLLVKLIFLRLFPFFLGLLISTCASRYYLTLVSPGITSETRLKKQTDLRMEEASFYGPWAYSHTTFYIEKSQLSKVLDDPNNTVFQSKEKFLLRKGDVSQLHLLFEFCYDKSKQIDIEKDMENYRFQLNGVDPTEKLVYLYPYSYFKKGKKFRQRFPFYERLAYPREHILITTGYDQLYCVRTLLGFDLTIEKQGKNLFEVTTPRNQLLYYEYEMDKEFVRFKDEEIN